MTTQGAKPANSGVRRAKGWTIADVIDFEYLLADETASADEPASRRTRELFQAKILPALRDAGTVSRPVVFRSWLDVQRDVAGEQLPGEHFRTAWQMLFVLSILAGLGLGGSVTGTLLFYHGDEPVNVPWFLACTLGVQLLVLIAAAVLGVLRVTTNFLDDFRPLRSLLASLAWWTSAGLRKLRGEQREHVRAVLARIERRREIYGSVATWPLIVLTQIFGVCFNLGILAVIPAQTLVRDIDFGWQSSIVQSDEAAFRITSGMAVPWKWFAPNPHPTLFEVTNSHFTFTKKLKNKTWWPFLFYAVAFYGLIPRIALLVFAFMKWRGALHKLTFDHEGCLSLYRQLVGPTVHAQSGTASLVIPTGVATTVHRAVSGDSFLLIADDVEISEDRIASYVRDTFGWGLVATHTAQVDHPSGNSDALTALAGVAERLASVIVVVPAKRSPIKAIALFVQKVAKAAGAKPELILLLVGRKEDAGFAPVDKEDFTYWKNFSDIHRLRVSLEKWSPT